MDDAFCPAVPILAYHAAIVDGDDCGTNDHVAFTHDLRLIDALGFRIVPLTAVVGALLLRDALYRSGRSR